MNPEPTKPLEVETTKIPIGSIGTRAIKPGVAFQLRDGAAYVNDEKGTVYNLNRKKKRKGKKRRRSGRY